MALQGLGLLMQSLCITEGLHLHIEGVDHISSEEVQDEALGHAQLRNALKTLPNKSEARLQPGSEKAECCRMHTRGSASMQQTCLEPSMRHKYFNSSRLDMSCERTKQRATSPYLTGAGTARWE